MITIEPPHAFSRRGKRAENQDCVFPNPEIWTPADRLFVVCDGVGGNQRGEIASRLACSTLRCFFKNKTGLTVGENIIREAVAAIQSNFDRHIASDPAAEKMATTLVLLYLNDDHVVVAYAGDSRACQIRNSSIVFKTNDHYLLHEWQKKGKTTTGKTPYHPAKNKITKAVYGSRMGPIEPDFFIIDDIRPNDFFFLCTDGFLEGVNENKLCETFHKGQKNNAEIISLFIDQCDLHATDNYSALYFRVKNIG